MPTSYKSHGSWSRYEPTEDQIPAGAPPGAMYAKRDTDGVDWYAYARDPKNFTEGSTKLILQKVGDVVMVSSSAIDQNRLFPQGATVLEVIGAGITTDAEALAAYHSKIVDLDNDTFTDPPGPPVTTQKADIWRRCTDNEADTLSNLLAALPARKRNLYNDCNYLDHADPFFTELATAVGQAIGQERAAIVLAAS
jgi:hypothetical protein